MNSISVSGEKVEVKYEPLEGNCEVFRHVNVDDCRQEVEELVLLAKVYSVYLRSEL